MGISGGSCIFWKTVCLNIDQASLSIRCLKEEQHCSANGVTNNAEGESSGFAGNSSNPATAIDGNLLGHKFLGQQIGVFSCGRCLCCTSQGSFQKMGQCSCDCTPSDSERATCQRFAERQTKSIQRKIAQCHLTRILDGGDADAGSAVCQEKLWKAQKKMQSLDRSLKHQMLPDDFAVDLKMKIEQHIPDGKGEIGFFEIAPTQADPCAAKRAVGGVADACCTDDGDFHMHIRLHGVDLMLKETRIDKEGNMKSCRLATGQEAIPMSSINS